MKKIYASMLVLAMGTCITAGARTYQRANINFDGIAKVNTFETVDNMMMSDKTTSKKVANVKANAGEGWINLGEGLLVDGIFGLGEVPVTIEESASTPGYYRVPDAYSQLVESAEALQPLEIDATDPNFVMIPETETGLNVNFTLTDGTQLSGALTIFSYSYYAFVNEIAPAEFAAAYPDYVITFEDGIVNIPEGSLLGIVGDNDNLIMINDDMCIVFPGVEYVPEWGEIATGQMLDTFFEANFRGYTAAEVNVPIQKNNKVEGVYRIIDPWFKLFGDPEADPNAGYYFVFDASDPDCVEVPYQSSYVNTQNNGVCYLLSASYLYDTKEEFLASEDAAACLTYDAVTRKINMPGSEVALSNGTTSFCGPIYFVYPQSSNPNGLYVLGNYETPGYIIIPEYTGISSVAVDNNNAKAEYYNIQGVRVNNPVAGQLYIVKKGNEVSKQIIR